MTSRMQKYQSNENLSTELPFFKELWEQTLHKTYTFMTHNGTHSEIIDHLNMRSYRSNKAPEAASKINSSSKKTGAEYKS